MDDTIDIEKDQHARFRLAEGRVVIYFDPELQALVVNASADLRLQVQQESDSVLSIIGAPLST